MPSPAGSRTRQRCCSSGRRKPARGKFEVAGRVRESTQAAAQEWHERVRVPGGVPDVPDAGTRSRCMQAGVAEVQRHHATWDEAQLWRAIWKFSHELPERGRIEAIDRHGG